MLTSIFIILVRHVWICNNFKEGQLSTERLLKNFLYKFSPVVQKCNVLAVAIEKASHVT